MRLRLHFSFYSPHTFYARQRLCVCRDCQLLRLLVAASSSFHSVHAISFHFSEWKTIDGVHVCVSECAPKQTMCILDVCDVCGRSIAHAAQHFDAWAHRKPCYSEYETHVWVYVVDGVSFSSFFHFVIRLLLWPHINQIVLYALIKYSTTHAKSRECVRT